MVKILLTFLLFFSLSKAENIGLVEEVKVKDVLTSKIQSFVGEESYKTNKAYINIIFSPKADYFNGERIDSVKIIHTLKENGLLNLYFNKPKNLKLNFKTSGSPLFFVKIMSNTLRNIGYYRYVTKESNLNSREFSWSIQLTSEYATDPFTLESELKKSGCYIVDIEKHSAVDWTYTIDMRNGYLNIKKLAQNQEIKLKRSLYAHWLNISDITRLEIKSSRRNHWYPKISYYDKSLHLLKVISDDTKRRKIILNIPKYATYIKISDIYTLKNIRDPLILRAVNSL